MRVCQCGLLLSMFMELFSGLLAIEAVYRLIQNVSWPIQSIIDYMSKARYRMHRTLSLSLSIHHCARILAELCSHCQCTNVATDNFAVASNDVQVHSVQSTINVMDIPVYRLCMHSNMHALCILPWWHYFADNSGRNGARAI